MMKDKIAGALYGVAVGDALGAPLEFMTAEQISAQHGYVTWMIGGGWLNVLPGEVTDDTAMTLAVAEGIMDAPSGPVPAVGEHFIQWKERGPKDIGGTCSASISLAMSLGGSAGNSSFPRISEGVWWEASRRTAYNNGQRSGGNGALMRTIYPGLYYGTAEVAQMVADNIGLMTHFDDKSREACVLYTRMVHFIIENAKLGIGNPQLEHELEGILFRTCYTVEAYAEELRPTGYVVDSFRCALHCLRSTSSFKDAVAMAANLGGDADTIAAITGGLAGAWYGYSAIPKAWIGALDKGIRERLNAAAEAAVNNRRG